MSVQTMDFFGNQDAARRKTSILIFYLVCSVVCIVLAVYVAFALFIQGVALQSADATAAQPGMWNPSLFAGVATATVAVVLVGSFYKILMFRDGGHVVAESMGGTPIQPSTANVAERRLLNVVEEMAIASGTPVPPVYIMEESGINAFAAGFAPTDAVIGVTRGCIENLSRDELQGVIAHEFSHILNGDMRLNIRLIGVLHGILLIGTTGYFIFRTAAYSGGSRRRDKDGTAGLVVLGLAIYAVGYIGVFFGRLIKSSVSRQREFLADAAAVQFTRNPDGIAGALKKIGGYANGAKIDAAGAEAASHLFFCNALSQSFFGLMATHPPLDERIRRIDPAFTERAAVTSVQHSDDDPVSRLQSVADNPPIRQDGKIAIDAGEVTAHIGAPTSDHLDYAAALLAAMPDVVASKLQDAYGAQALIYSLLIHDDAAVREAQLGQLDRGIDSPVYMNVTELLSVIDQAVTPEMRLPLVDRAIPTLRTLSEPQYYTFKQTIESLSAADNTIDLFEYALKRVVTRHLDPYFGLSRRDKIKYYSLKPFSGECADLLSVLAYCGHSDPDQVYQAYRNALVLLGIPAADFPLPDRQECDLGRVDRALNTFVSLSSPLKKTIIRACAACIATDGYVTITEAELFRAIADCLDCPAPPFIAGQQIG